MKQLISIVLVAFCSFLAIQHIQAQDDKKDKKQKKREKAVMLEEESSETGQEEEEECEVLLPSISKTYEGRCKNGLAHGKGKATGKDVYEGDFKKGYPHGSGVFTYDNGDVYSGFFRMGRMDGEGSLSTVIDGRDTVLAGIWMDGVYVGPKPKHPQVLYKYGVDSYSIKRARDGNRFLIDIFLNGMPNTDLENFAMVSTSGNQITLGRAVGYENVSFPVTCKVSYNSWNKLHSSRHEVIFEFKIEDPGDWKVKIIN